MMSKSLYWKGLLTFGLVTLVAVGIVALLTGRVADSEFRRYAFIRGGDWRPQVGMLSDYYRAHGSWEGVQTLLPVIRAHWLHKWGGRGASSGVAPPGVSFRLTDATGHVIADTPGAARGSRISNARLSNGIPVEVDGKTVGYLIPEPQTEVTLDVHQMLFLKRLHTTLWVAALAAMTVALLVGGLLFRSIVAPLRHLTAASQMIASGDFSVRAPVQGKDEVAQLARAFNQMAESLTHAEEARRNQTADIAHELRTPLTVLQGELEAMLDGIYPTDRENLQAALAQVQTLTRLVADLRLLALADAGQLRLYLAPLDIVEFLSASVESYRWQALERRITLNTDLPASPVWVMADRDRLSQVIGNLLSNGLRYVPAGGQIAVEALENGDEIHITVRDNGPGVPSEDLPHLFDRFWRGDRARRRSTGGSGLGLSIARQIIQAHGGRIWATLPPPGGLAISLALRLAADETR